MTPQQGELLAENWQKGLTMPGTNQVWLCTVCGYIHRGADPPEACPVCGAPGELFELQADSLDLFSIGQFTPEDASFRTFDHEADGHYLSFVFRDYRLVGAVLLRDTKLTAAVKRTIESQMDCSALLTSCRTARELADALPSLGR